MGRAFGVQVFLYECDQRWGVVGWVAVSWGGILESLWGGSGWVG